MYHKYKKRRSVNYLNLNHIEQVSYYLVEDDKGNETRELAIYFTSGRVYKERAKAVEVYKNLKETLDKNLYNKSEDYESEKTNFINKNNIKLPIQNSAVNNNINKISIKKPSSNNDTELD